MVENLSIFMTRLKLSIHKMRERTKNWNESNGTYRHVCCVARIFYYCLQPLCQNGTDFSIILKESNSAHKKKLANSLIAKIAQIDGIVSLIKS